MNYKRLAKKMTQRNENVPLNHSTKKRMLKNIQHTLKQKGKNTAVNKGSFFHLPVLGLHQSALSGAAAAVLIAFFVWSNSKQQGFLDFNDIPQLGGSAFVKQNDTAFWRFDTID